MIGQDYASYGFQFIEDVQSPVQLGAIGIERRFSDYYYDNANRRPEGFLFQFTLEGRGILEQNENEFDILPGMAFLVSLPGREKYYLPEESGKNGWRFIYIILQGAEVSPYFRYIVERVGNLLKFPCNSRCIQTLKEIFYQAREGKIRNPFIASELAYRFLCQLCIDLTQTIDTLSPRVLKARHIIGEEYSTLEGIGELADRLGVTAAHLSREFYRETGSTLIVELTRMRLQHSVELLRGTALSIDVIAKQSGFSCGAYYSKVFKKYVGVTPFAFRRDAILRSYTEIVL